MKLPEEEGGSVVTLTLTNPNPRLGLGLGFFSAKQQP